MRKLKLILSCLCLSAMACGGNSSDIEVTPVPNSASLIPAGTTTVNGGAFSLTAPYFTVSSINLLWKGTGTFQLNAIIITFTSLGGGSSSTTGGTTGGTTDGTTGTTGTTGSSTSTSASTCSFGGDQLVTLFPSLVNSTGTVVLTQGQAVQASGPFGCGGVSGTIPMTGSIEVVGAAVDSSGNSLRVTGTATITID